MCCSPCLRPPLLIVERPPSVGKQSLPWRYSNMETQAMANWNFKSCLMFTFVYDYITFFELLRSHYCWKNVFALFCVSNFFNNLFFWNEQFVTATKTRLITNKRGTGFKMGGSLLFKATTKDTTTMCEICSKQIYKNNRL